MEKKFTKGPWDVFFCRAIGEIKIREISIMPAGNGRMSGSQHIAKCWDASEIGRNGGLKYEEAKANAKLIAAAPEMLESLEEVNRLKDLLSLPEPTSAAGISEEYISEFQAIDTMLNKVESAIKKALEG